MYTMGQKRVPGYCLHKPSGRGYARFGAGAKPVYFPGPFDSDESRAAYHAALAEYLAGGRPGLASGPNVTVLELVAAWMGEASRRYRKFGRTTSEVGCYRSATRFLIELYGGRPVANFGPQQLAAVRQKMIDAGWVRASVNMHVSRVRSIWKWGVSQGIVPAAVWQALVALAGLRKGKSSAIESVPKRPVTWQQMLAVLRRCWPDAGAMIRLQYLAGMRPCEVAAMRPCDVDRRTDLWCYSVRPEAQKTGKEVYWLGPRCQAVLAPWLLKADGPEAPIFALRPRKYTSHIQLCCDRAKCPRWGAHQLRHNHGTRVTNLYGREAAAGRLNHSEVKTTARYSQTADAQVKRIARELG